MDYTAAQEVSAAATGQRLTLLYAPSPAGTLQRLVAVGRGAPKGVPLLPTMPLEKSYMVALRALSAHLHRIDPTLKPTHAQKVTAPMRTDRKYRSMTLFWYIPETTEAVAAAKGKGLTVSELFLPGAMLVGRAEGVVATSLPSLAVRGASAATFHALSLATPIRA